MEFKKGEVWFAKVFNDKRPVLVLEYENSFQIKTIPLTSMNKNNFTKVFESDEIKSYSTNGIVTLCFKDMEYKLGEIEKDLIEVIEIESKNYKVM